MKQLNKIMYNIVVYNVWFVELANLIR